MRGYCDFAVVNDGLTLRLFNTNNWGGGAVRPGVGGGNLTRVRWQEVDYTENGNPNAPFPDDWTAVTGIIGTSWNYTTDRLHRFYLVTANN